jgi:uncharacterized protein involved in exopolysaccharide biosynthesis
LLVLTAAFGALVAFPKSYHVESKLIAQRNAGLSVRGDSNGGDAPTRAAAETVLRHDNLVAMARATDLVDHYAAHLAPATRLRAALQALVQGNGNDSDRLEAVVDLLATHFNVWSNEGTVTIAIDWPNAKMAYRLVDYAQQSFLEARHIQEVSSTAESVAILQGHATALRADVDTAVDAVKDLRDSRKTAGPSDRPERAPSKPAAAISFAPVHSSEPSDLTRLRVLIEAKQRAIGELDEVRRHRLSELQGRLVEQRTVYTENHPVVIDLKQAIASVAQESPQVTSLKEEVAGLRTEADRKAEASSGPARSSEPHAGAAGDALAFPVQLPADILAFEMGPPEERDPAMVYARGRLREAMERYGALRSQIQAGQIDLETAEAAFKYRYAVVTPAQVPKRPTSPNVLLVTLAAILGGLFAGLLVAVLSDVRSGRLIERWQVELLLDRPILGDVELPALPPGVEP